MNTAHLGFGALSYDVAHLLDGAALILSFFLLYQTRILGVVNLYAAQAMVLTAAAFWQGWVQSDRDLYFAGIITLLAKVIAIPMLLRRVIHKLEIHREIETTLGIFASMIIGLALVVLAVLAVLPATTGALSLVREDMAMALSVVLLGLLTMITRRNALTQAVGFLSIENGLILAALGAVGMPMIVELSVAVLVLVAAIIFGVFVFRIRERFESLDITALDRITGAHR
jgi:hydrogenase-4 component E